MLWLACSFIMTLRKFPSICSRGFELVSVPTIPTPPKSKACTRRTEKHPQSRITRQDDNFLYPLACGTCTHHRAIIDAHTQIQIRIRMVSVRNLFINQFYKVCRLSPWGSIYHHSNIEREKKGRQARYVFVVHHVMRVLFLARSMFGVLRRWK